MRTLGVLLKPSTQERQRPGSPLPAWPPHSKPNEFTIGLEYRPCGQRLRTTTCFSADPGSILPREDVVL